MEILNYIAIIYIDLKSKFHDLSIYILKIFTVVVIAFYLFKGLNSSYLQIHLNLAIIV